MEHKLKFIIIYVLTALFIAPVFSSAQQKRHDKGVFEVYKNDFYKKIKKSIKEFKTPKKEKKKNFRMDFKRVDIPKSVNEFTSFWRNPSISQGNTGIYWDFSTTSFLESEIYRIFKKKMKFSEMYTAYWEYVEKARRP